LVPTDWHGAFGKVFVVFGNCQELFGEFRSKMLGIL
jgi:hypothetical protein